MPSLRKLSPASIAALEQIPLGTRAQVAREYDGYLAGFAAGDYGRAELAAGERRAGAASHYASAPAPIRR
jgi:hypothetical protein